MNVQPDNATDLSLAPLGAGDLIDRAVRIYRKNFWTLILIAAPPVFAGTLFSVGWTFLGRGLFSASASPDSGERAGYYMFIWFGSILIWLIETIATLVVMGGASRNFVRHLLFGEALSFKETYRNTFKRLGSLVVSSTVITVLLGVIGLVLFYFGLLLGGLAVVLVAAVLSFITIVAIVASVIVGIGVAFLVIWLFFMIASRFAYVPQVMLVEGQGAFSAIGRSASLASGNVRRLMALFVFSTVAAYSALAILYVPLAWYAWGAGVEIMTFNSDLIPAWYEVAYNMIWQISFILLSPVWTIGLCLLYVDERVRSEGYDIELMAARRLGEIPNVPQSYVNPLQPALGSVTAATASSAAKSDPGHTTLGLD
jgi:hypothetical protein